MKQTHHVWFKFFFLAAFYVTPDVLSEMGAALCQPIGFPRQQCFVRVIGANTDVRGNGADQIPPSATRGLLRFLGANGGTRHSTPDQSAPFAALVSTDSHAETVALRNTLEKEEGRIMQALLAAVFGNDTSIVRASEFVIVQPTDQTVSGAPPPTAQESDQTAVVWAIILSLCVVSVCAGLFVVVKVVMRFWPPGNAPPPMVEMSDVVHDTAISPPTALALSLWSPAEVSGVVGAGPAISPTGLEPSGVQLAPRDLVSFRGSAPL